MKIIAISGKAQHGKTTTSGMIKNYLDAFDYRVLQIAYADVLKFICQKYFGWDGKKDSNGRDLLQYVGTNIIREKEPDFFVNFVSELLKIFENEWDYVIIDDARFPNEIELLKEYGFDYTHIKVVRPLHEALNAKQAAHPSETALDNCIPNDIIVNDGDMYDLALTVDAWLNKYMETNKVDEPIYN